MKTAFAPPARMTAAEYAALPPEAPLGQLIEGTYFLAPAPRSFHQIVVSRLNRRLEAWAERHGQHIVLVAPTDVFLDDDTVVQPDLLVLRREHRARLHDDGLHGAPDLAIEVLSESSRRHDLVEKPRLYLEAGVTEYWVVDPERATVLVYVRRAEAWDAPALFARRSVLRSPAFAGLEVRLAKVFAPV